MSCQPCWPLTHKDSTMGMYLCQALARYNLTADVEYVARLSVLERRNKGRSRVMHCRQGQTMALSWELSSALSSPCTTENRLPPAHRPSLSGPAIQPQISADLQRLIATSKPMGHA